MKTRASQPLLFDRDQYLSWSPAQQHREQKRRLALEHNAHSFHYECWLARSRPRRQREIDELFYAQRARCWRSDCPLLLRRSSVHVHHLNRHQHPGDEDPHDIVLVHGWCHRILHDRPDLYYPEAA